MKEVLVIGEFSCVLLHVCMCVGTRRVLYRVVCVANVTCAMYHVPCAVCVVRGVVCGVVCGVWCVVCGVWGVVQFTLYLPMCRTTS